MGLLFFFEMLLELIDPALQVRVDLYVPPDYPLHPAHVLIYVILD